MPKNTQIRKSEENAPEKKLSKERLSLLVRYNATGEHSRHFAKGSIFNFSILTFRDNPVFMRLCWQTMT